MKHIGPDSHRNKHAPPQARVKQPRRHSLLSPHAAKPTMYKKQRVYPLSHRGSLNTMAMPKKDKHGYY